MKKFLLLSLVSFLVFSCSTTSSRIKVTRVGEEPENYKERAIYVLPQTAFLVSVEFEKETYIPGPYRLFTERFLGLEDYIAESSFAYNLLNVDVESFTEPDPEHFYSVNLLKGNIDWDGFLKLSEHGLVMDPVLDLQKDVKAEKSYVAAKPPYFTDLSVKRNLQEVTDTLYKTIIRDSSYVRVPVLRSHREAKTLEQKAEEAANFIIKIRKRRFKLLAGQYDVFPEGDALAISVKELDQLEREYLELFLGKTVKEKYRKSFVIIPESNKNEQSYAFARFSPMLGLMENDSKSGKALEMILKPQKKIMNLPNLEQSVGTEQKANNLYYRIPDIAEIEVRLVNEVLYEGRRTVFQMGSLVSYPVSVDQKK